MILFIAVCFVACITVCVGACVISKKEFWKRQDFMEKINRMFP